MHNIGKCYKKKEDNGLLVLTYWKEEEVDWGVIVTIFRSSEQTAKVVTSSHLSKFSSNPVRLTEKD